MDTRDAVTAVLGTVVVGAVGVGGAIGLHSVVGEPAGTPASSSPGVTLAMSDDVCELMGELHDYLAENVDEISNAEMSLLMPATTGDEPDIEALHAFGQSLLDFSRTVAAYEHHAAEIVDDPTTAAAFTAAADAMESEGAAIGQQALDATSVEEFFTSMFSSAFDTSSQEGAMSADEATAAIVDYAKTECAIDLKFDQSTSVDSSVAFGGQQLDDPAEAAQADVTYIGQELDDAFADWQGGDPLPQVNLADGYYTVQSSSGGTIRGSSFPSASSDAEIADQIINGPIDWCVAVTVAGDTPATYRNSSTNGVEEGTCAELVGG